MAARETARLHIPYPALDDQGNWDATFVSMIAQIDARIFANLENLKPVFAQLPSVTNDLGARELQQSGDWVLTSRTFATPITVPDASVLALQPGTMIGVRLTAGAVSPQASAWETVPSGADVDAEFQVFGAVDASYNIIWYNGAVLAPGDSARLFDMGGSGGVGGDTVKITGADPTASYLNNKLAAGANITLTVTAPGMFGETLEVAAAGPGDVLSGHGNPNAVVAGNLGQLYRDLDAGIWYINDTGAQVWSVH